MAEFEQSLRNQPVFLTGHTGFTGGWLAEWLNALNCSVAGYSLAPETTPNLFSILEGANRYAQHDIANITDHTRLKKAMEAAQPSVVFHLAAQPLVRRSFRDPLETFASNVLGTASVLEAARSVASVKAVVCITTDKVYENRESPDPYNEDDRLGGKDPYSASKACAELVASCYQQTMTGLGNGARIATARGGNIIGGGDWSEDRIVPDYYRALTSGHALKIRNPGAIRPWQHVLSACHGYLAIAADLLNQKSADISTSWNIGPTDPTPVSVGEIIELLGQHSARPEVVVEPSHLTEANILKLDTNKAATRLGVRSPWTTEETVRRTAEWYAAYYEQPLEAAAMLSNQLEDYRNAL